MSGRSRTSTIETMLVMIIFIFFAVAVFSLISAGAQTYKKILDNKEGLSKARVAVSYINVKIRQNDFAGMVHLTDKIIEGVDVLAIEHIDEFAGMTTYIFHQDGTLFESFIDNDTIPSMDNAMRICDIENLELKMSNEKNDFFIDTFTGIISHIHLRISEETDE